MERINHAVFWYQQKIGTYDKQLWEQSVEQRVLKHWKSIHQVPKKTAKAKPELIDVDLVRGSTFSKTKPQHGLIAVSRKGVMRVVFLPFYIRWWEKQTSLMFTVLLFLLYTMQVAISGLYLYDGGEMVNPENISLAHILVPMVLMLVLGLIHAQIIATRDSHKSKRQTPKAHKPSSSSTKTRRRKTRSRYNRVNSAPNVSTETTESKLENGKDSSKHIRKASKDRRLRFLPSSSMETDDMLDSTLNDEQDLTDLESRRKVHSDCTLCQCLPPRSTGGVEEAQNKPCAEKLAENMSEISVEKRELDNCSTEDMLKSGFATNNLIAASNGHLPNGATHVKESVVDVAVENHVLGELVKSSEKNHYVSTDDRVGVPEFDSYSEKSVSGKILPNLPTEKCADHRNETALTNGISGHVECNERESSSEADELCMKCDEPENLDVPLPAPTGSIIAPDDNKFVLRDDLIVNCDSSKTEGAVHKHDVSGVEDDSQKSIDIIPREKCNRKIGFDLEKHKNDNNKADCAERPGFRPVSLVIQPCDSVDMADCDCKCHDNSNRLQLPKSSMRQANHVPKESTGVSSAESEFESTPHSPTLTKEDGVKGKSKPSKSKSHGSVLDWESTINNEVTSSDSTSCTTENTDISDADANAAADREDDNPFAGSLHTANSVLNNLASGYDNVSCMIWEGRDVKKVDLSVLEIGWTIIQKVDKIPEMCDYIILGFVFTTVMSLLPVIFRAYHIKHKLVPGLAPDEILENSFLLVGSHWKAVLIVVNGVIQRFCLTTVFFFLLSVAEKTFKQRLQYAKHFCYLTSSRRAKKYELPHFRLNKVRNIKTWLSLRSYLKKRGPQRSVDCIVSAAFILAVMLLSLMCVELLQDSGGFLDHLGNWELVAWCMGLGIYLLRFMTLGTKINKKYRNFSVLITEQINLYLQMEQKPHKKDELTLANNVLKLAEALLKELESPFKISGLAANPFLYNVTKVVILSAFSAVLTELVGFKLKLYKIKLR